MSTCLRACRPCTPMLERRIPRNNCGSCLSSKSCHLCCLVLRWCGGQCAASILQRCAGNNRAVAARLQNGVETTKAVSFWLYNMLSQPLSSDQLLLEKSTATQLSSVANSSRYDLRFATPDSLRSSEVRGSSMSRCSGITACRIYLKGQEFLESSTNLFGGGLII